MKNPEKSMAMARKELTLNKKGLQWGFIISLLGILRNIGPWAAINVNAFNKCVIL